VFWTDRHGSCRVHFSAEAYSIPQCSAVGGCVFGCCMRDCDALRLTDRHILVVAPVVKGGAVTMEWSCSELRSDELRTALRFCLGTDQSQVGLSQPCFSAGRSVRAAFASSRLCDCVLSWGLPCSDRRCLLCSSDNGGSGSRVSPLLAEVLRQVGRGRHPFISGE
jgi:hypothetical protein